MVRSYVVKIGSKGEVFPPKEVREELGLTRGQPLIMTVDGEKMTIRKLHSVESILNQPAKTSISSHALKEMRRSLGEDAER